MSVKDLKSAVTGKTEHPLDKLRTQMLQNRESLAQLLGRQNVDVFIQVVMNACVNRPELLEAYRPSLFSACRAAALDGLYPDGKEAVLNIYKTKMKGPHGEQWVPVVQYLPMVRGLIKLIWNTEQFTYIDARAVYERDFFSVRFGDDPGIEHSPYDGDEAPGLIKAAYFVGRMKSGEVKREVMFRRDIEKARQSSKTKDSGPWVEWYDQMAIKSVIHRVWKQLPSVPALDMVIQKDAQAGQVGVEELLMLPESVGGEPYPTVVVPRTEKDPIPATERAQDKPAPEQATGASPETRAAAKPGPGVFTVVDALAAVGAGDFDLARDIVRGMSKVDQEKVEAAITQAQ